MLNDTVRACACLTILRGPLHYQQCGFCKAPEEISGNCLFHEVFIAIEHDHCLGFTNEIYYDADGFHQCLVFRVPFGNVSLWIVWIFSQPLQIQVKEFLL